VNGTYLLRIDVPKLAERLGDEEHRRVSNGDAFAWLSDRGFKTCRRGWYAPSEALNALDTECILHAERLW
jgi:hypothetical protein